MITLDDKLLERVEMVFDQMVNKVVDDNKRSSVIKTWIALKNARKARIHGLGCDNIFNNNLKIGRAEIIGPWR